METGRNKKGKKGGCLTGFFEQVYEVVKQIPKGKVMTYGQIAGKLGTRDARRVGWALHGNKEENQVPCHRVVNKEGGLALNFGFGGGEEQRRRLELEEVKFLPNGKVDMKKYQWKIDILN